VALIGDSLDQSSPARSPAYTRPVEFLLCLHEVGGRFQTPCEPDTDNAAATLDRHIRSMKTGEVVYLGNSWIEGARS
jgi:hypothetical protein